MTNIFVSSAIISIIFTIAKIIEMKTIENETKPLKVLLKDSLLVYFSVIISSFLIEQIQQLMNGVASNNAITPVFTDNPGF